MSILCCINGTSFANNVLDNQKVTNRDIANLVLDQFDALKKSVKSYSSYEREPKHIIIVYAGDLDIDKITDEFRPLFRGGVKTVGADYGYLRKLYEKEMSLITYLWTGIPNWFKYSMNYFQKKQSLLVIKDPIYLSDALNSQIVGERGFDRTVTFIKPEILLKGFPFDFCNDIPIELYIKRGFAGLMLIRDQKFIKFYRAARDQNGITIKSKCGINGNYTMDDDAISFVINSSKTDRDLEENPFYLMGLDPIFWRWKNGEWVNPEGK
jgi:hypothetical protein